MRGERSLVKREVKTGRAVRQYRFTDEILTGIHPSFSGEEKFTLKFSQLGYENLCLFLVTFRPFLTGFSRPCTGAKKFREQKLNHVVWDMRYKKINSHMAVVFVTFHCN